SQRPDIIIADYQLVGRKTGLDVVAAVTAVTGPPRHTFVFMGGPLPRGRQGWGAEPAKATWNKVHTENC
ncbi:MAG: hypothetical protein FD153_1442, partial [Rhodospirillaceae bacterium]